MISSSQRPLPDNTQHWQQTSTWQHTTLTTNIQAPGGIRTHDLSRRVAADLRLRPRGHWDRLQLYYFNIYIFVCVFLKVKWSRYRPGVAQSVGRGIALLFHDRGTRRGWVASSTPRPHFTPGKEPVPILQGAGWAPGPVWMGGKSRPHRDSIPARPVRSQSLYRLSYPAHSKIIIIIKTQFHSLIKYTFLLSNPNSRLFQNFKKISSK